MSSSPYKYFVLAVICLAVALIWRHNGVIDGLGKAMAGVFMICFFIVRFFGEQEA